MIKSCIKFVTYDEPNFNNVEDEQDDSPEKVEHLVAFALAIRRVRRSLFQTCKKYVLDSCEDSIKVPIL